MSQHYQPYTLPALPRHRCPHEVYCIKSDHGMRVDAEDCNDQPEKHTGWCSRHAYVFELLQAAAEAGYPELDVNPFLRVGAGVANWEGYARRHLYERHQGVMRQLKKARRENEEARRRAVENARICVPDEQHVA